MPKLIDALYPLNIPSYVTCDLAAAYIDHDSNPDSFVQMKQRFPTAQHVSISVQCTVGALVLDCERSTGVMPRQAVNWTMNSRDAGIRPTVYCNYKNQDNGLPAVLREFAAAKVKPADFWVANYDNVPIIPPGCSAKQYWDLDMYGHNTFDTSIALPGWPFAFDKPAPQESEEYDMYLLTRYNGSVWFIKPDFSGRFTPLHTETSIRGIDPRQVKGSPYVWVTLAKADMDRIPIIGK